MSTIRITAGAFKDSVFNELDFKSPDIPLPRGTAYKAVVDDIPFHSGEDTYTIYHATLTSQNSESATDAPIRVVFKMVLLPELIDGLYNEAETYTERLAYLQGIGIPKFYGLFRGTYNRGRTQMTLIVLQDVGQPLGVDVLLYAPWVLRKAIIQLVLSMHIAGVTMDEMGHAHNYVLDANGTPFVVGLSRATEHKCTHQQVKINCPEPRGWMCPDLEDLCREADMWSTWVADWFGGEVNLVYGMSVDDLLHAAQRVEDTEAARGAAENIIAYLDAEESRRERFYGAAPPESAIGKVQIVRESEEARVKRLAQQSSTAGSA